MTIDELPDTFHGCYLYNNGEFPYIIKKSLACLVLDGGDTECLTKIIGVQVEPGTRFIYQGAGKPIVEYPDGDSCIWNVAFEVVPIPKEHRHYLMRWNPTISSFTKKDYEECTKELEHGMFRINWSIHEWEEARRGDVFYMMRSGDEKAGIVFSGLIISDPYPCDDWNGTTKRRMYVDLACMNVMKPNEKPNVTLKKLQKAIPSIDWAKGHSGELLSEDVAMELGKLLKKK